MLYDVLHDVLYDVIYIYMRLDNRITVLMYKNVRQSVALENELGPASPFCSKLFTTSVALSLEQYRRIPQLIVGFPCWSWLAEADVRRPMRKGVDLSILIGL